MYMNDSGVTNLIISIIDEFENGILLKILLRPVQLKSNTGLGATGSRPKLSRISLTEFMFFEELNKMSQYKAAL